MFEFLLTIKPHRLGKGVNGRHQASEPMTNLGQLE